MTFKETLKKIWNFIWHEDSVASWVVNVVLAFILVKFVLYPGLGFLLGTSLPVVAVVSGSMEHDGNFNDWWTEQEKYYTPLAITKEKFLNYPLHNGFNKGDLIILTGPKTLKEGDVIVFKGAPSDPIIHRLVKINSDGTYQTKGDHNTASRYDEVNIREEHLLGKAVFRIPYLGLFKLGFVKLLGLIGIGSF